MSTIDHQFEPEFLPAAPRPIPRSFTGAATPGGNSTRSSASPSPGRCAFSFTLCRSSARSNCTCCRWRTCTGSGWCCWALTLNAWLDDSRARPRPLQVEEMVSVTHNFIVRHYEIKYKLTDEPGDEKRQFLSTPWEMGPFFGVQRGWADEREGYFGWAWIEGLRPLGE